MKISVVGLGKLGLPLAATIASKNFFVYGVDVNKKVVDNLNKGLSNLSEPDLLNLIKKYKANISATTNIKEAILDSDITFIITPTPSQKNGYFSLQYVNQVLRQIGRVLALKKSYHLVVVVSTIMPGSMDKIKDILEKTSGKKCIKDFGLCYNPEFIALGSVIYNLLNPDFVLIGESDKKAGDILQAFYKKYCLNKTRVARMNFINAELTKISVNTYITTKISYANMLAEICEKLPNGDVDVVTEAIGLDSRIGSKYLKGGPAFGGPCFPRDNKAFISLAKNLKSSYGIADSTHKTNLRQTKRLIDIVIKCINKDSSVGILGLSYKPFTDVIDESSGILLAQALKEIGVKLNLHDPIAIVPTKKRLGETGIKYFDNLVECIKASDILVITTNWPEYKNINKSLIDRSSKTIIDPWRMLNLDKFEKKIKYIPLGVNIDSV